MAGVVIPVRWRLALLAKALLLLAVAAGFAALAVAGLQPPPGLRLLWTLLALPLALFLTWAAVLGAADAVQGRGVQVDGAIALRSRRAGHSLRLPDGRFAEHILWNVWDPLVPDATYRVTYGRRSRVLVARPERL